MDNYNGIIKDNMTLLKKTHKFNDFQYIMCFCILLAAPGSSGHGFDSRDLVVQNTNVVTTHAV